MTFPLDSAMHRVYGDAMENPMGTTAPHTDGQIRVEHDGLPHGYCDGYLTDDGLFVTRRDGAGWLWDVWVSVEAFCTRRNHPAALVAGNLPLSVALTTANEQGDHR